MIQLPSKNLVVIDLETSGTNPFLHDVLTVGLVPLTEAAPPCVVHVRPKEIYWSRYAKENFARFSAAWESEAVSPIAACEAIEQYLSRVFRKEPVTAIGHNVGFDMAFLRKLAFLAGKEEIAGISHRALDTHTILYLLFLSGQIPSSALSSDGAFKYFDISVPKDARHTALGDALATRELFLRLLDMLRISNSEEVLRTRSVL
jgi:DNA polymerase-3 subunit epsilon